jgi:O-antigen ligase
MIKLFLKFVFTTRRILWMLVLWQLVSVLLMALGVWPDWLVWVNLALAALYILGTETYDGLLLLVASIPFFIALPDPRLQFMPTWRILFILLFGVWAARTYLQQRQYFHRLLHFRQLYREARILEQSKLDFFWTMVRRVDSRFLPWDKFLALFLFVALLSTVFARFRVQSLKQIIFAANIYLIYVVLINTATTRERVVDLIRYAAASATIIVLLGYVQFIATLFIRPFYFWQYWAVMVSRLYYGLPLANVLVYSNSWFSYSGGQQELRMFSIMPDSHSFAMVAVFCMGFCIALLSWYKPAKQMSPRPWLGVFSTRNYYMWYLVRFAGLAVILSGTRGIWVGMIAPIVLAAYFYAKKFARPMMRKILLAEALIILLFVLSPFINYGLNWFRVSQFKENFIQRAQSIYDLSEESNVGRLIIWQSSLGYAVTHPFGVGYGNFVVSLVRDIPAGATYADVAGEKNLRYNLPQKFVSAHSLYLNILVELGFAGLLAFAVFWWEYAVVVWRFIKQHGGEDNIFTLYVVSMAFTMLWFLVYGVFDVTLFNDKVLMYFFISLGITGIIIRRYGSFEESRADNMHLPPHPLKPGN